MNRLLFCALLVLSPLTVFAEDSKTIKITEDHPIFRKIKEHIPPIVSDANLEVTCKIYTKPNTGYLEIKTLEPFKRIVSFYYRADVSYNEHGAVVTSVVDINLKRGRSCFLNRLRAIIERIAERIVLEEQAKAVLEAGS